jgi:diaminopimelate decarboxylase
MEGNSAAFVNYQDQKLYFGDVSIDEVTKKYKTPFYLYSKKILEQNYSEFEASALKAGLTDPLIAFAMKSNNNVEVLRALADLGAGADIVSGGELLRALECNIPAEKIVFSGVGKTDEEIKLAIEKDIYSFNVESIEELEMIEEIAEQLGKTPRICFRLNPKVHAKTHKHISTGYKTHKFGILCEDIHQAFKSGRFFKHSKLVGLSIHIGSQLTELDATGEAIKIMCLCAKELNTTLEFLDVGGGLGVNYKEGMAPTIDEYMQLVSKQVKKYYGDIRVVFEPGRRISASCGFFVTKVLRSKVSEDCRFLIVDGGMNDFVRPSLYDAYHHIYGSIKTGEEINTDIVGPICETADCFGTNRKLAHLSKDDYVIISDTGAYGHTMSSTYNMRPQAHEYLIE